MNAQRWFGTALALVLVVGAGSGCSAGAGDASGLGPSGVGGSAGAGGAADLPTELAFVTEQQLLTPRQQLELVVRASPPGSYVVRFSLPTVSADPGDAVLDRSEAETATDGTASVILTAPSSTATFSVLASIDGSITATLPVSVSESGAATVRVQPMYTGHRAIKTWFASARTDKTCAELPGTPPEDGPLGIFSPATRAPELSLVPAGTRVTITLRSGYYVGGCTTVEQLPPGRATDVQVTVLDRPISLEQSPLSLSLGLSYPENAWSELLIVAREQVSAALLGTSTDDADALLDAMRGRLSGTARQGFDAARRAEGWDALVRSEWGPGAATRLRDRVADWMEAGAGTLGAGEHVFEGDLRPVDAQTTELTLATVAGLPAGEAGFTSHASVAWSAEPDDTIVLGAQLFASSSRLATALASAPSRLDFADSASVEAALAQDIACAELGPLLASQLPDPDSAYPACDAACLTALCQDALAALWLRGREATSTTPVSVALTAAGLARVGDVAEVVGVSGSWVGELTNGTTKSTTGGPLSSAEPPVPTR